MPESRFPEPFVDDPDFVLYVGDAVRLLPGIPSESVDCCVTSPPYWGLRDYGEFEVGLDWQLGLEPTPEDYVGQLVTVLRDVKRILRDDGTLWLNLGDSYAAGGGFAPDAPSNIARSRGQKSGKFHGERRDTALARTTGGRKAPAGLKPKDLVGIPWRVALALQADGWYLRSDIIWAKPNPMPESVTDRPTRAHEYLFLLSKSPRYYYDAAAIAEPAEWARWGDQTNRKHEGSESAAGWIKPKTKQELVGKRTYGGFNGRWDNGDNPKERNKRSVWEIATRAYPDAHFAVFPEALVEPCVLAGSPVGGTVLDPFMGSGTTALVARRLGRRAIGIELNPGYAELAARRLSQQSLLAAEDAV